MSMINVWNLEFAGHAFSKKTHLQTGLNISSMVHWFLFLLEEVLMGITRFLLRNNFISIKLTFYQIFDQFYRV